MTKEDRELYNRLDSRLAAMEPRIIRLDEKLTGGNGGGICKTVGEHSIKIDEKLGKKEFAWVMGVAGSFILIVFSLLITGTI